VIAEIMLKMGQSACTYWILFIHSNTREKGKRQGWQHEEANIGKKAKGPSFSLCK